MPAVLGSLPFKKRRELVKISHKGKPSHDALPEANRGKTAPNPAGSPGIAADDHSEGSVGQIALGMETSALARTASKDKGFKYRVSALVRDVDVVHVTPRAGAHLYVDRTRP